MPDTSNQPVSAAAEATPPPPAQGALERRPSPGWVRALGLAGAGVIVAAAGLWFLRFPLAEALLRAEFDRRAVEGDFHIVRLDFRGVSLAAIRLGAESAPDAVVSTADVDLTWRGLRPEVAAVRLVEPRLRLSIDESGRMSAGALQQLASGGDGAGRPALPRIRLAVDDGQALVEGPFGALTATFEANGTIGRDFSALARIAETSLGDGAYRIDRSAGEARIASDAEALSLSASFSAGEVEWDGADLAGLRFELSGSAPLDLSSAALAGTWRVDGARHGEARADAGEGSFQWSGALRPDALALETWRGEAQVQVADAGAGALRVRSAVLTANAEAAGEQISGAWRMTATRLHAGGLVSNQPSAAGALRQDAGRAQISGVLNLAGARLDAGAQADLRRALPTFTDSPVSPLMASARQALLAAADRFDINAPFAFAGEQSGARLTFAEPIVMRAPTGAALSLAPLRDDAPMAVLQWPGPSFAGGVAADLTGGGAPNASLLLDTLTWSSGVALEAEGTLDLADWRAGSASAATQELIVRAAFPPGGGGRIDLLGPATLSGPVGDGQVSGLVVDLDLAIAWRNGWSMTVNRACLPIRIDRLQLVGLAFDSGALSLCPDASGRLIAADASDRLSGGFIVADLRLDGRTAGAQSQPARLSAERIVTRFEGTTSAMRLRTEALRPALAIDMDADRTLEVRGARVTADTEAGGGAWNVVGAFESGALSDPALPGEVAAIAGQWRALPEGVGVTVAVDAGEAFVFARPAAPGAADQRPLFQPVRLADVAATLSDGRLDAQGRVVLDSDGRALADFTAEHDLAAGEGGALIAAPALIFDDAFQPYHLSELLRGGVANVQGTVAMTADAAWTQSTFGVSGVVRPQGVSLSMATIPIIRDVSGEVRFNDLLALTTPPGQAVTIGELNPGVAVHNGRVRFQLLSDQRVAIEAAEFDFADGVLAVAPTTITLGAEETRFDLALRDLDVAALVATLNAPDLQATGRVEGSFPIRLTSRTAFIENGVLRAAPGGGAISYVGHAGDGATGASRVAFDALRSFRYDDLTLALDGDISGEIVSEIRFQGRNVGETVNLSEISGAPVALNARGVPFAFDVSVRAPFRQLARTAAGVFDPGEILDAAVNGELETPNNVAPSVDVQVDPLR